MTLLQCVDLSFSYPNGVEVLDTFTHEFTVGAVTAVTGPSGRGKSTLLYLLGLMLTPTAGDIRYGGASVSSAPDAERSAVRAHTVGFVFQDAALDNDRTVLDNVVEGAIYSGVPRREASGRARGLLERYGVDARWNHRPGEVSGGQAQRIALCRALVSGPSLVLADEPTGNLDRQAARSVLEGLRDAAGHDATVVVATHDPTVVAFADEVLHLGGDQ